MRDDPLARGIGVLKTLLGAYVISIAAIAYAGSKAAPVEDPVAIESQIDENFVVLSCNEATFAMRSSEYEALLNLDVDEVGITDNVELGTVPETINKSDLQVLMEGSYDDAVQYLNELDNSKGLGR